MIYCLNVYDDQVLTTEQFIGTDPPELVGKSSESRRYWAA
jgi:hypothetical protein